MQCVGKIVDVMPINWISCSPAFNLFWIHDSVVKKFHNLEKKVSKQKIARIFLPRQRNQLRFGVFKSILRDFA